MNTAYIGFLGGFVALLLAAGSAQAQFGPPNPDVDRDGKASFAEYRSVFVTQTLKRLDADKDGRVSRAEYQKAIDLMSRFAGPKIAARETFSAAVKYFSSRGGETESTSPMLSKP